MARKARFNLIGIPQHIVQRGHNRGPCFFAENDYLVYLDSLTECAYRSECEIHAYALMANHAHLLVTPHAAHSIPTLMQGLGRQYVRYINQEYRRSGTLWQGRYKACLVESEEFVLACGRYIELNPVRVAAVKNSADYRWSSYRHNALGAATLVIRPHQQYLELGSTAAARQSAYCDLFRQPLDNTLLYKIRAALNQELILGTEKFKNDIERLLAREVRPRKVGRPQQQNKHYSDPSFV